MRRNRSRRHKTLEHVQNRLGVDWRSENSSFNFMCSLGWQNEQSNIIRSTCPSIVGRATESWGNSSLQYQGIFTIELLSMLRLHRMHIQPNISQGLMQPLCFQPTISPYVYDMPCVFRIRTSQYAVQARCSKFFWIYGFSHGHVTRCDEGDLRIDPQGFMLLLTASKGISRIGSYLLCPLPIIFIFAWV